MSVRLRRDDVVLVYTSARASEQGLGLIKYIGPIGNSSSDYIGIELLEPIENGHNGVIGSNQYFECKPLHGIHIPKNNVIAKLTAAEVLIKFQEAVSMFRSQIFSYSEHLKQRDSYIADLIQTQKKFKTMISAKIPSTTTTTHVTQQSLDQMIDRHHHHLMSASLETPQVTSPQISPNDTVVVKDDHRDERRTTTNQQPQQQQLDRLMINRQNTISNSSRPHLLNLDSKMSNLTSLSRNSWHQIHGIVGYEDSDREETASLFSANSSVIHTPKSPSKPSRKRKFSKSSKRRSSSKQSKQYLKQTKLLKNHSSNSNRSHSKSKKRKSKSKNAPYIINSTPRTMNASNDNILEQQTTNATQRRKSQFAPSQRYSFRATPIQEEENEDGTMFDAEIKMDSNDEIMIPDLPNITPFNSENYFFNQNVMGTTTNNHKNNNKSRHVQSSSDVQFGQMQMTMTKPAHLVGSLQNIHQQQQQETDDYIMPYPQIDHWIEEEHVFPLQQPHLVNKSKSMPASAAAAAAIRSIHLPSQQSIEMNPYIDEQIMFEPTVQHYYAKNDQPPPIATTNVVKKRSSVNNNLKTPSSSNKQRKSQSSANPKIGKVKFAPRKSQIEYNKNKKRRKSKSKSKMSGITMIDSMY